MSFNLDCFQTFGKVEERCNLGALGARVEGRSLDKNDGSEGLDINLP